MNRLASILPAAQVLVSVDATSKKRAFEEAGLLFENLHGLSAHWSPTASSPASASAPPASATAWPSRMAASRPEGADAAVFELAQPIGFDAPDEQPVALLIFLLVPEAATQKHLEILSEIAELLSDAGLREKMKTTTDASALHGLIASWQSAQAPA